jgi:hypothetical protein
MKKLLAKVRPFARRVRELFPFTFLGVVVLAAAAYALFAVGIKHTDLILLVVGAAALLVGVLCLLFTTGTALALWLALRKARGGEKLGMECGFSTRSGFSVSSLWFVPFVKLGWAWLAPEARVELVRHNRRLHEVVTPTRRGLVDEILRRVDVGDAFGLTRISFRFREERSIRFFPSVGSLRQMNVVRSIASGEDMPHPGGQPEGERADLRRYQPGDPVRFILWKVFAKSREVVVRTPERAIAPARQTCAYQVTGDGDEAAAGAARVAMESGSLGTSWVLGADGAGEPAKNKAHGLEVLAKSSSCEEDEWGAGLASFLKKHAQHGNARVVVFVPPTPGPWLERVAAAARSKASNARHSPVEFVVCTDGMTRDPKTSWFAHFAFDPASVKASTDPREGPAPTPNSAVAEVVNALAATRASVLIVDRRAGRVFGDAQRRALGAA